jgi:hypothetical protein
VLLVGFIIAAIAVLVAGLQLWKRLGTQRFAVTFAVFAALAGALVLLVRVGGCADPPALPELERDGSTLVHPYGFEITAPPPELAPDPELEAKLGNGYMRCWAWTNATSELIVCGQEIEVTSRAQLEADIAAVRHGIDRAVGSMRPSLWIDAAMQSIEAPPNMRGTAVLDAMARGTVHWQDGAISWSNDRGEARLSATVGDATIRVRLLTVDGGLAVVWAMSRTAATDATVASLRRR